MDLKQFERIEIETNKLSDYLLNIQHPDGFSKAKFFLAHKFNEENLLKSLLNHLESNDSIKTIQVVFGTKYVIEAKITAPDNYTFTLRSIWMKSRINNVLKFVSAYPI